MGFRAQDDVVRSLIAREGPIDQDVFGEEYQRKATSHGKCRGKGASQENRRGS